MQPQVTAIILAAGASRRLGQPKQLVQLDGKPLILRLCEQILPLTASVKVVTGAIHPEIMELLSHLPVGITHCPNWNEGMSASLKAGLEVLPEGTTHLLLCLSDQPLIPASHYEELVRRQGLHPQRVVATAHSTITAGVPALFPLRYRSQLQQITGDKGARVLLKQLSAEELVTVHCEQAAFDVDRSEHLDRLHPGPL